MLRRQISRGDNGLMYRCFKWDSYQGLYTDRDSEENLSYITNERYLTSFISIIFFSIAEIRYESQIGKFHLL